MEAVAAHPLGGERPRQGELLCERRRAAMKGGVEAGDLRHFGCDGADRADRGDVVRLVQRRQRHQFLDRGEHFVVDQHRLRISEAAMDHAMADPRKGRLAADMGGEPVMNSRHRAVMIVAGDRLLDQPTALRIGDLDSCWRSGCRSKPLDLAMRARGKRSIRRRLED